MRILIVGFMLVVSAQVFSQQDQEKTISTIVIGSCALQSGPQDYWNTLNAENPELFLFIGDNIYADNLNYRKLKKQYSRLGKSKGFQQMRKNALIMAVWDDHDYGLNDGGSDYVNKHHSKKAFLKFFKPPKSSRAWRGPGIYRQRIFGKPGQQVQVILLDTRFFRSPLKAWPKDQWKEKGRYIPDESPEKTMLGEAQWYWLSQVLKKTADVRLIITSIQAIPSEHGFEKWSNFPHERKRLFQTIKDSGAHGVVLISGDRHAGELSILPADHPLGVGYPLYELTSSGLNTKMAPNKEEPNPFRLGEKHIVNHYGVIKVNWGSAASISFQLKSVEGDVLQPASINLSDLR